MLKDLKDWEKLSPQTQEAMVEWFKQTSNVVNLMNAEGHDVNSTLQTFKRALRVKNFNLFNR